MPDYYFDLETTGLDYRHHKIISIQYQRFDTRTGITKGKLVILKEWESTEKEILQEFYDFSKFGRDPWAFVMVGSNLNFDLGFIRHKLQSLLQVHYDEQYIYQNHPTFDLKAILKILNRGTFRGAKLCNFMGKPDNQSIVPEWYAEGKYDLIIDYIKNECCDFLNFYRFLVENIRRLPDLSRILPSLPE